MQEHASVFRTDGSLGQALAALRDLGARYARARVDDRGRVFNQALLEAWETGCLLDAAEATVICALARTESRGSHFREDHPTRDDAAWLKHTLLWRRDDGRHEIGDKPVTITRFPPRARAY
jgi:succinate dehydrogenase / fumarate reductase flavoprotein subunit